MSEPLRVRLLAFTGMNARLPASALRPRETTITPREVNNMRPHILPLLEPREAQRFADEADRLASANHNFPYGKVPSIVP